jgi:hypothetical protein
MSRIWRPMLSTGFSDVIGSWNTTDISRPRIARKRRGLAVRMSSPSSSIRPSVTCAFSGRRRISALIRVDLPQPDSPTTPTISPACTSSDTPRSACRLPCRVS